MCEQNTLSKLYGNLLQTSSLWHRADRGTTRSARDPSGTTRLRTCPQDDIVFLAGGFAPCTPIRNCEHSCLTIIVQFDILFFHKQVCQQSEWRSHCISSIPQELHIIRNLLRYIITRKRVYHPPQGGISSSRGECTFGDDIRQRRWYTRLRVMICQACGLDKKIPRTKFSEFFGSGARIRT